MGFMGRGTLTEIVTSSEAVEEREGLATGVRAFSNYKFKFNFSLNVSKQSNEAIHSTHACD